MVRRRREDELALLTRRWSRALAGEGQFVQIVGEPGIGKSGAPARNKAVIAASCRRRNSSGANFAARSSGSATADRSRRGRVCAPARAAVRRLIEEFRGKLAETPHTWVEWAASQLLQNTPLHPLAELGTAALWRRRRVRRAESRRSREHFAPARRDAGFAHLARIMHRFDELASGAAGCGDFLEFCLAAGAPRRLRLGAGSRGEEVCGLKGRGSRFGASDAPFLR